MRKTPGSFGVTGRKFHGVILYETFKEREEETLFLGEGGGVENTQ